MSGEATGSRVYAVGDWTFDAAAAELRRDGARRRLEDRSARALELLCRRAGEVVSGAELVTEVWNGRALSPNSVAVVIRDLRTALQDDARDPTYIETISKRGYRLLPVPAEAPEAPATRPPQAWMAAAAGLIAAAALAAAWFTAREPAPPTVVVRDTENATGDARYAPLARSVTEVAVTQLSRTGRATVRRGGTADSALVLSSRLVLWTGHPAMSLTAEDPRSGQVVWSYMAKGPESALPAQIRAGMDGLGERLAER